MTVMVNDVVHSVTQPQIDLTMTQEHPITPPPELVDKLASGPGFWTERLVRAFQAGADFELEACVEWLINEGHEYEHIALQNDRRPKPPSLKEQALCHLESFAGSIETLGMDSDLIRRALESLPE
jgi:hypothetical protein